MVKPNKSWYKAMDMVWAGKYAETIQSELLSRPDLLKLLNEKARSFIVWAATERLTYIPDLNQEVSDFLNIQFTKRVRAYSTNVKEWIAKANYVFKRDNYTCQYCGKVGGILECDHVIPFSKGGSDELDNLTTSCRKCNRSKRDKSVNEFKVYLENQIPA